ncbi:MAG: ATP-binding protein [Vampirovibrio sp.]|nr:ATP-binding protein [Vampirovibrio sp.]
MLIEFSVENYKCFATQQTLNMRPDPDIHSLDENLIRTGLTQENGEELVLLPTVAIYGANASGKSNLLESLNLIAPQYREDRHKVNIPNTTFFNNTNGIQFKITECVKKLDLTINSEVFHCEASNFYIFRQAYNGLHFRQVEPTEYKNLQGVLLGVFRSDFPVIDSHYFRKYYLLNEIIKQSEPNADGEFDLTTVQHIPLIDTLKDEAKRQKLLTLVRKADFNIEDIKLIRLQTGREKYSLQFKFKGQDEILYFDAQSEGTKRFLLMMPTIVHVLETGAILLADELEQHLHPDLCKAIVELFNSRETNPHGSQLIFTTHNLELMDLNRMRPDQIYFINKDEETGASELYRASDYDMDWNNDDKWSNPAITIQLLYEMGRFSAHPKLWGGLA